MERKALGRGLSTLLGPAADETLNRVAQVSICEIRANPQQPRREWHDESLSELADSIRENGVLQPLIARGKPGNYELVAGERRLRAASLAGLTHVPVLIRETNEEGSLRLALIENIQREDISPIDAAQAYQHLLDRFGMTQEDVARAVGKSRSAVANSLRLLKLPTAILESLRSRTISEGHARALLAIDDPDEQERLWRLAESGATVRDIEAGGRRDRPSTGEHGSELRTTGLRRSRANPHLAALADRLRRALGTRVEIRGDEQAGVLSLEYYSKDDLQHLTDRLLGGDTFDGGSSSG